MFSFYLHFKLSISSPFDRIKLIKTLFRSLFFILLIPSNTFALESNNHEGTSLNLLGIAVHSELRNDIYIGAMFAPKEISNYKLLYDPLVTKNMSLRFLKPYSQRKVARLWKQRIAMNNDKSAWQPLTKDIIRFAKLFKRPMKPGDEMNLVYIPNKGTKLYLNGSLFLLIRNPRFYTLLLNTWYGNVPPSKLFKTGITGSNTDYFQKEIVAQYELLISIPGRFDQDKLKTRKIKTVSKPKQTPKSTAKKQNKKQVKTASLNDNSTQNLIDSFKPILPKAVTEKEKNINNPDKETLFKVNVELVDNNLNQPNLKTIDLSQEENPATTDITENQINNSTSQKIGNEISGKQITTPVAENNNDEVSNEYNDIVDDDLISGGYSKELVDFVKKSQKYPKRALQKRHEGDLVISLTVNRIGSIVQLSLLQRSDSRYLDKGVLRQIRGFPPFPPIPESLKLETFNVEIPMSFSFSK